MLFFRYFVSASKNLFLVIDVLTKCTVLRKNSSGYANNAYPFKNFPSSFSPTPLQGSSRPRFFFFLSQNIFFTLFIFEYCCVECYSKLLADDIPLAFKKNLCIRKGVYCCLLGCTFFFFLCSPVVLAFTVKGANVRITHQCVYLCMYIYITVSTCVSLCI